MSTFFHNGIDNRSCDDVYSLVTSILINGLGKSETLITEYQRITNIDISRLNHDMILYQVVRNHAYLVPSFAKLSPCHRTDVVLGIKLGAEFNFSQLAQAENVPACLFCLKTMKGHTRAFDVRFMEQLLDIAGAGGHVDLTCGKKLMEPVFQAFKNMYDVSIGITEGKLGIREGYDVNLTRRVEHLVNVGWEKGQELDVSDPIHRALMRLLCISNSADVESADLIHDTLFNVLSGDTRRLLVRGLNFDGSLQQPAVQAIYIPAVSSAAIGATKSGSKAEKEKALAAAPRYLSRTLEVNIEQPRLEGVVVIERDIRRTIMHTLNSERFREDPDILDNLDVPSDEVAKMAEGYEWVIL
ncbi:uncharacterized protein DFL_001351 [Arthrobotrys flagrans]|uniref:Uncharacterized protein n=1 Tax=Arthrobotrys flagrans TaxID=97331 RepID=A0A437AGV0_ARTFL|nr:hypothetical protein DFL_001351 [Arthrobotrys flagrans]